MNATLRLRVLFIVATLEAGGAERVVAMLAGAFAEESVDVTVLTLAGTGEDFFPVEFGVRRIGLGLLEGNPGLAGRARTTFSRLRAIRRVVAEERPDVVVSFVEVLNIITVLALMGTRTPVAVSERTVPWAHSIGPVRSTLRKLLYPRAAVVVVQTESVATWTRRFVDRARVVVLPNPVDVPPAFAAVEREPVVLALGRLSREKGFDLLVDAFGRIAGEFPDWTLRIGGEGIERDALERRVEALGLASRIELPGLLNAAAELERCGVFVLPSRFEGFPNALLEAMAHGVAVIAADAPAAPREIVHDEVGGLLVPCEDVGALSQALRRLLSSPADRERLGQGGRQRVTAFATPVVAARWLEVLSRVAADRGRAAL